MLDYLLEFSENYKEVSRFSYVHLNTAHEGSGTVVSTLDDDLVDFLTVFFKTQEKSVLFLMGDHGMRYGSWFTKIDGSHEHRLPLLMITQSESMKEISPISEFVLNHNSNRLVSKFDLYTTLKYLTTGVEADQDELVCSTSFRYRAYNLFSEAIPDNRTCEQAGIPLF